MLNKISSVLSILSFIISLTTIGAGYAGYRYITSPQFEAMMMEKIMGSVNKILPGQIDKKLPKINCGSILEYSPTTKFLLKNSLPSFVPSISSYDLSACF